jgi:DNA-binding LacI/PurR family transcriptional regulator
MVEALTLELEERDLTPTVRLARDGRAECDAVLGATTADVEGVLICPHHLTAELLGDRSPSRPSVQVGGGATGLLDCMVMDEFTGSLAVARHLVRTGRRRIAFITDSPRSPEHSLRFRSYAQALEESGIEVRPEMRIAGSDWDRRESGIEATLALLRSGTSFDAIMCVNDAVAIGALRTLRRSGVRVPADVAVTGFDNTAEGGFTAPTLTTVDPDIGGMARGAVQMLAERLSGMTAEPRAQSVPSRLVVRRSTGSAEGESAEG